MLSPRKYIFIFLLNYSATIAQPQYNELSEAEHLFSKRSFAGAIQLYRHLYKYDSTAADLNYKIGVCYLNSRSQKNKAADYFEKALGYNLKEAGKKNTDTTEGRMLYKMLGDAYCYAYQFEPAMNAYKKHKEALINFNSKDTSALKAINSKLAICRIGQNLKPTIFSSLHLVPIQFTAANSSDIYDHNFKYIVPSSSNNQLYQRTAPHDHMYYEEIHVDLLSDSIAKNENDASGKNNMPSSNMDTISYAANVGSSVDGQIVLTYKNEKGNADLYITRLKGDTWSVPEKLDKTINTIGWENNECLSADGNTMYFTSRREGGFGGTDIYVCKKLPGGDWGKAINPGPTINTEKDEEAPFIHPDGKTLFYSSDRNKPGSYDVFSSVLSDSGFWEKSVSVGYPVNRLGEDFFEVKTEIKKDSIVRPKISRKNKKGNKDSLQNSLAEENDNFLITFINQKNKPLTLLKGTVTGIPWNEGLESKITVTDNLSETDQGIYFSNSKTGHYAFILPFGKNVNVTYEAKGYLFQSENIFANKQTAYFQKQKSVKMEPLMPGSKTILNNVFFEADNSSIDAASVTELKRIVLLMNENPGMKIEISNYLYSGGNKKQAKKLSIERANSVLSYLTNKGIAKERIDAKGKGQYYAERTSKRSKVQAAEHTPDQMMELKITEIK